MQTLETRGSRVSQTNLAVLTAALAIATLLAKKFEASAITHVSGLVLVFSASSLVVSLIYASFAHAGTSKISLTDEKTLDTMTGSKFMCRPVEARFVAAKRDAETVKSLYIANEKRGAHLEAAVALQIVFVVYLVLAVSVEIMGRILTR